MKKLFNLIIVSLYLFAPLNNEKTHQILRENKKIFKSINLEEKIHYLTTNDYSNLNESEIYYFLINGGIIINDKSIDKHIYESFFSDCKFIEGYNSCIYFDNNRYNALHFSLNDYNYGEIELSNQNYTSFIGDIIDEVEIQKSQNDVSTYDTSLEICNNKTTHIVYKSNSTIKMCSYSISIQIVKNSSQVLNNIEIGNYTARSSISLLPESSYSITDYSIECTFPNNLTYLSSSTNNNINNNQVFNEAISDTTINIECDVSSNNYGIQMGLSENIIFNSINDINTSIFSTKLTSLKLKDNGWWLLQKKFTITDENKYKLTVYWNKNGLIDQEVSN